MVGWKQSTLSYAGKTLLMQHTLQSLPIYSALVLKITSFFGQKIDRICNRFLWPGNDEKRKPTSMTSDMMRKDTDLGGLGQRKINTFSKEIRGKLGWRMI